MHRESKEINDSAWDCTLIKKAKENADLMVNAIYDWSDRDVWDYINDRKIDINPLYEMGFTRVGCVLCPLASFAEKQKEMQLFPTYKQAYIAAFQRMVDDPNFRGSANSKWETGEDVFDFWIHGGCRKDGQIEIGMEG